MSGITIKFANDQEIPKTFQAINKAARDAALAVSKATIGTEEYVKASKHLDEVKAKQAELKKQVESTTQASNNFKQSLGGILNQIPGFSAITGVMKQATGGVGGLSSGMGVLKFAMMALPIFLIIGAVTTLVGWFTKTERGADALAKMMAMASAAIDVLRDRAFKLVDALIAFVKGDWTEATEKFGEATRGVVDEIIKETEAAGRLADALDALEESEGKMILVRSRMKSQIAELRKDAKDDALSFAQRAAMMKEAIALTQQLTAKEVEVARAKAMTALGFATEAEILNHYGATLDELIAKGENLVTVDNLGMGESTQDDLNKAMEALANLYEVKKEGADEERSMRSELLGLNKKMNREEVKDNKEALAEQKKDRAEYLEAVRMLEDNRIAMMAEGRERDLERLKLDLARQIEALDINAPLYAARVASAVELGRKQANDIITKWDEKEKADSEAKSKWEDDKRKEDADKAVARERQKQQDIAAAMNGGLQVAGNFFGVLASMQEEGSKQAKEYAYAQAVIGAIQGGINAYTSTNSIPYIGPALAPFAAALALATGMANANKIKNQKVPAMNRPKAELGGPLYGPSHAEGGIPIEAEGGEFIFSKRAVARIGVDTLSRMNNQFAAGGPVSPFAGGAEAARNAGATGGSVIGDNGAVLAELKALRAEVKAWPTKLKVINVVTETEEGIKTVNQIRDEASV